MKGNCVMHIPDVHVDPSIKNNLLKDLQNNNYVNQKKEKKSEDPEGVDISTTCTWHMAYLQQKNGHIHNHIGEATWLTLTNSTSLAIAAVCKAVRLCCTSWAVGSAPAVSNIRTSSLPSTGKICIKFFFKKKVQSLKEIKEVNKRKKKVSHARSQIPIIYYPK